MYQQPIAAAAGQEPAPGQVWGEYRIGRSLGKGSFGQVYEGTHMRNHGVYAVKFVNLRTMDDSKRFYLHQEIDILKSLQHPYIIRLFEIKTLGTYQMIVTELCAGGSLADLLARGPVPEGRMQLWAMQLVDAMCFLRERKIAHRDLKPANILLSTKDENAQVKLCDFGFARTYNDDNQQLPIMQSELGSPLYEAPEIRYRNYGPSVDLWSLGLVLLETLLGRPAISVQTFDQLHAFFNDPRDMRIPVKCSPECMDLLSKLLKKNAEERISWKALRAHPFVHVPAIKIIDAPPSSKMAPVWMSIHVTFAQLRAFKTVHDLCVWIEQKVQIPAQEQTLLLCGARCALVLHDIPMDDVLADVQQTGLLVFRNTIKEVVYPTDLEPPPSPSPAHVARDVATGYTGELASLVRFEAQFVEKCREIELMVLRCYNTFQSGGVFFSPLSVLAEGIVCFQVFGKVLTKEIEGKDKVTFEEWNKNKTHYTQLVKEVAQLVEAAKGELLPPELVNDSQHTLFDLLKPHIPENLDKFPPTGTDNEEIAKKNEAIIQLTNLPHALELRAKAEKTYKEMGRYVEEARNIADAFTKNENIVKNIAAQAKQHVPVVFPETNRNTFLKVANDSIERLKTLTSALYTAANECYHVCVTLWTQFYRTTQALQRLVPFPALVHRVSQQQAESIECLLEVQRIAERTRATYDLTGMYLSRLGLAEVAQSVLNACHNERQRLQLLLPAGADAALLPVPTREALVAALTSAVTRRRELADDWVAVSAEPCHVCADLRTQLERTQQELERTRQELEALRCQKSVKQ
eukprot:TRINITY_DN1261_c0_g1_i1.p1 TRINITY_DN1261_c0_g1~~TRINITY_DN1261_c0_g1_i1.p1  ORF type:complete len:803 (-),score=219.24 TRINITY_DN1261_c0_g1_i1:422-2830(-)